MPNISARSRPRRAIDGIESAKRAPGINLKNTVDRTIGANLFT